MPRRSPKHRRSSEDPEDVRSSSRRRSSQEEEDEGESGDEFDGGNDGNDGNSQFQLSQQIPEASQNVLPERPSERHKLDSMDDTSRDKALTSLSRLILFKALDREPIDRLKAIKEAELGSNKISSAAMQDVADRLRHVFGFGLRRIPKYMEAYNTLPAKFKDRLYVVNEVADTQDGSHSKAIHSVHDTSSVEKGLLMLTLALLFCKGESRSDGSRHMLARDLYRLLHQVDDSLPEEPPAQGTARAKAGNQRYSLYRGNHLTPNVDALLEQFLHWDYLIKEKATEDNFASQSLQEGDILYAMGPRAAMEIGRKQIIHFCAEVLDEEPDPSMLKEVEEELSQDYELDV